MIEIAFHPLQPTEAYLCFLSVLPLIHVDPNKWKKVSAVPVSRRGQPPPPQVCPMWLWPVFISRPSQPCEPHQPQTRSRLCPGLTPLPEEERAEEGCHQVPASSQKYICPSPAVCDLALLSRALSEDRCPPAPAPSDVLTPWEDVNG